MTRLYRFWDSKSSNCSRKHLYQVEPRHWRIINFEFKIKVGSTYLSIHDICILSWNYRRNMWQQNKSDCPPIFWNYVCFKTWTTFCICELENETWVWQIHWNHLSKCGSWKVSPQCELEDVSWVPKDVWSTLSKFHNWTAVGLCELEDDSWVRWTNWSSLSKCRSWTVAL